MKIRGKNSCLDTRDLEVREIVYKQNGLQACWNQILTMVFRNIYDVKFLPKMGVQTTSIHVICRLWLKYRDKNVTAASCLKRSSLKIWVIAIAMFCKKFGTKKWKKDDLRMRKHGLYQAYWFWRVEWIVFRLFCTIIVLTEVWDMSITWYFIFVPIAKKAFH